jgi:hypothetical protein
MKTKATVLCILAFTVLTLIISCNETSLNDSGTQQISYISHKSNGCVSVNKLMKTNDEAILNYEYSNGNLKIEALFTTQCAADFKDSVMISGNSVNIFLADTASSVAKCLCPFKEEFNFELGNVKEINVLFCLNNYVLADTLFKLY